MTLEHFAKTYRLALKRDDCGDYFVPGRLGQIYLYNAEELGVIVMPPGDRAKVWPYARRRLTAAGCAVIQNGDTEGCALFDPEDVGQAKLAMKLAGVRARRRVSPECRARKVEQLARLRENQRASVVRPTPCEEEHLAV